MSALVIYQSETGFTKKYAEWIGTALDCEVKPMKQVNEQMIASYDYVIFGGWIMGNMVVGLDKIRKMPVKELCVFGVGSSRESKENKDALIQMNHLSNLPFYYMEGGFHFEKLGFIKKSILKMIKKSISKKENKTEQDLYMQEILGTSFDYSNINNTKELVVFMKQRL
jgi:menaquinone-dependent protoporphyrinogen IX oxidase